MNRLDFLREYFSKTGGAVYICALRNSDSPLPRGEVNRLCTRDLRAIESFVDQQDQKEHQNGIYFATATIKEGQTGRKAENCYQFPAIFADIDDKNHSYDRKAVLAALERIESPPTIVVDSGHGLQAHWLLSEPSEDSQRIVDARRRIQDLTASDAVHDAPRVMRLPGTHNGKEGDWLEAKVISHYPERRYTLEALQDWLDRERVIIPRKQEQAPSRSYGSSSSYSSPHNDEGRIRDALGYIPADDRDTWLKVGFALENELGPRGRTLWDEWSARSPHKFNGHEQDRAWNSFKRDGITIATLFKYAQDAGWREQRTSGSYTGTKRTPEQCEGIEYVRATDVAISAIRWLWPNRIAIGKLTLIAGMPDEGKSQIVCDIVARLTTTRGDKHWPCKEGVAPSGDAIMFSAEDDPGDTLKPRLIAAGADLDRVMLANMVRTKDGRRLFDLAADIGQLRTAIKTMPGTRVVSFDPLNAYFGHGRVDTFRNSDVRAVLGPLADLAAEFKVAVIGLLHFNKKADLTNVMLRMGDSIAFSAAARAVYAVVPDEENKRKLLIKGKNNLAPAAAVKTLAYYSQGVKVGTDPESCEAIMAPHIVWHGSHVDVSATEAMQAAADNRSPAQIETAMEFLKDLLAEGAIDHDEIKEAGQAQAITYATLRRAKDKLEIEVRKESGSLHGKWYWRLRDKGHPWPWDVRPASV